MAYPPPGYDPQVSDDEVISSPEVSDDEDGGGGIGRASRGFGGGAGGRGRPAGDTDEDIFAPEIHVEDNMPKQYFAWLPTLLNNCAHSFVGGWAYVIIQYLSRMLSERHQRSTIEAIRAREEELQYMHYAQTHIKKDAKDDIEYLFLQAAYGNHHWSFPKGHVDDGEDEFIAAIRETQEEVGLLEEDLRIHKDVSKSFDYNDRKGIPKTVTVWPAEMIRERDIRLSEEHQDYKWLQLEEAVKVSDHMNSFTSILSEMHQMLSNT